MLLLVWIITDNRKLLLVCTRRSIIDNRRRLGRKLLKAVQRFSADSRAHVRVGIYMSEWFLLVMSPLLCNVSHHHCVVREVNARVLWEGLKLIRENGGRFEVN